MMTRQDLERLGHKVRGTYRGPLDWELCTGLYNDLQQSKREDGTPVFPAGTLYIVRQDPGFNIVTVEAPKPIVKMTARDLVALTRPVNIAKLVFSALRTWRLLNVSP